MIAGSFSYIDSVYVTSIIVYPIPNIELFAHRNYTSILKNRLILASPIFFRRSVGGVGCSISFAVGSSPQLVHPGDTKTSSSLIMLLPH